MKAMLSELISKRGEIEILFGYNPIEKLSLSLLISLLSTATPQTKRQKGKR
jgi:hypothetical protein